LQKRRGGLHFVQSMSAFGLDPGRFSARDIYQQNTIPPELYGCNETFMQSQ